jgi:hypothetical protein
MYASRDGHHEVVRTLLESGGLVNAKDKVRNQMMIIMILFTILMMTVNDDRRSMHLC